MGHADVQRRVSERGLVRGEPGFEGLWRAEEQPLSLAGDGTGGWLTGWLLISTWDTYTYARMAVQNAIMLACVVREAWLFGWRGPKKVRPTIGGKKQLLVALRETGRPTCRR